MRITKLLLLTLIIVAIAGPAFAQATNPKRCQLGRARSRQ